MKKTLIFLSLMLILATTALAKPEASTRSHGEGSGGLITVSVEDRFETMN